LRQVTWGGDPDKAALITPEGRLNPRKSFDAWRQTVQLRSARWRCEELESARALAALIDIERREIAEKAVRDSEARLQGMLDHALAMICIIDLDGRYLLVNRKFEAEFGLTGVEVAGKTPDQLLPPAIAEQFMASDRAVIESLQARSCEESIDSPHGVRTLLSNRFPLLDATGQATAICQLSLEITDRLQAEQALRVALTKYKTLFDAFPLGITVCDSDGEIIETNAVSERMLGLPTEQHLQRRIGGPEWTILRPDGSPMPPRNTPRCARCAKAWRCAIRRCCCCRRMGKGAGSM
jgi:PAS domain S-box-containing protein